MQPLIRCGLLRNRRQPLKGLKFLHRKLPPTLKKVNTLESTWRPAARNTQDANRLIRTGLDVCVFVFALRLWRKSTPIVFSACLRVFVSPWWDTHTVQRKLKSIILDT